MSFNLIIAFMIFLFIIPIVALFVYLLVTLVRLRRQQKEVSSDDDILALEREIQQLDEQQIVIRTEILEERKKLQREVDELESLLHEVR